MSPCVVTELRWLPEVLYVLLSSEISYCPGSPPTVPSAFMYLSACTFTYSVDLRVGKDKVSTAKM